jgi:hypothetical protein
MSLTHEESQLFAALWLKAGDDRVLHVDDAGTVATRAIKTIETDLTPCARERVPHIELRPAKRPLAHDDRHSSWVH